MGYEYFPLLDEEDGICARGTGVQDPAPHAEKTDSSTRHTATAQETRGHAKQAYVERVYKNRDCPQSCEIWSFVRHVLQEGHAVITNKNCDLGNLLAETTVFTAQGVVIVYANSGEPERSVLIKLAGASDQVGLLEEKLLGDFPYLRTPDNRREPQP
jgi:hypothetical protein